MIVSARNDLKIYTGYSFAEGQGEGAVLVFAHNIREAKKLAYPYMNDWFDSDFLDVIVKLLSDCDHLYTQADKEKLDDGIAHVIDNPAVCENCELWGGIPNVDGTCSICA